MAKYLYTITVNAAPQAGVTIDYPYGGTACTLTCGKGCAVLCFGMGTKKDIHDPEFFQHRLVKDSLRKLYLLHAMAQDSRLWIDSITVTRNDETAYYDARTPLFPFLFSMLTARELELPESWREEAFLRAVLERPKSGTDNDPRYACLFSFLAALSKHYEVEKFACFWTAMNAHYNYLFARYLEREPGSGQRSNDSVCIGALMRVLGCGERLSSQKDRNEYRTEYGALKNLLRPYAGEELKKLCRELQAHRTEYGWVPEGALGEHLHKCLHRRGKPSGSAWGFLLLEYAYYMRCKYFHGNKATVLFAAANDPEIAAFRTLNALLSDYLREAIPGMFAQGWFTEEMLRAVRAGIK